MAQKFDARGYRDSIEPQKTPGDGSGLTVLLACICGVVVLAFGGAFAMMSFSTAEAVQSKGRPVVSDSEFGEKRWAAMKKRCEKKAYRRKGKLKGMEKQVEQHAMLMGMSSGSFGRMVVCMGAPSKKHFCNDTFRTKFTRLVKHERTLAGNGPSDMEKYSHSMSTMVGGKGVKTSIHARQLISKKIKTLLVRGLLRRDEFSNYLYGEPEWLTKMIGKRKQPDPCTKA